MPMSCSSTDTSFSHNNWLEGEVVGSISTWKFCSFFPPPALGVYCWIEMMTHYHPVRRVDYLIMYFQFSFFLLDHVHSHMV